MNLLTRAVATVGFSGYSFIAPGTAGSAVALVVYCLLPDLGVTAWIILAGLCIVIAVPSAEAGARFWGEDPPFVVIDEFAGFFVTVAFLPQSMGLGVAAFFIFRVLDILKPFPARQSERLPGGVGIVADDVIVGVYGNLLLCGMLAVWPGLGAAG